MGVWMCVCLLFVPHQLWVFRLGYLSVSQQKKTLQQCSNKHTEVPSVRPEHFSVLYHVGTTAPVINRRLVARAAVLTGEDSHMIFCPDVGGQCSFVMEAKLLSLRPISSSTAASSFRSPSGKCWASHRSRITPVGLDLVAK